MNFYNFYKKPLLEYTHNFGVILNGFVYGFNSTILPGIDAIRQGLGLQSINFYINTWSPQDNQMWINKILADGKKFKHINIFYNSYSIYSTIDVKEIWKYIYNELGIRYNSQSFAVDKVAYKRLIPMIISQVGYKDTYDRIANARGFYEPVEYPLLSIKPSLVFRELEIIKRDFLHIYQEDINNLLINYCPETHKIDNYPYDTILTAPSVTPNSIPDKLWIGTPRKMLDLFGHTLEDSIDRFIKITQKYLELYPYEVKSIPDFNKFCKDIQHYPIEGSVFLKEYSKFSKTPVNTSTGMSLLALIKGVNVIRNPWYSIEDNKILLDKELEVQPSKYPDSFPILS